MNKSKKGFTLLELLIVIAIIAILSVVLIIIIDPAETLKKSRDSQRISDLNTMKTALGIYLTSSSTPNLDNNKGVCFTSAGTSNGRIAYSYPLDTTPACTGGTTAQGTDANGTFNSQWCYYASSTAYSSVDGTGWIPVNLTTLVGGSPISNLPIDPVNTIGVTTAPTQADLVYRYACQQLTTPVAGKPGKAFELGARLESATYGSGGSDDRSVKDGGDNANLYEVGSSLKLMASSTNI